MSLIYSYVSITADLTVRVVFSPDEIEEYAACGSVAKEAKVKIRNSFASLSMYVVVNYYRTAG
jgi:hypothetical protein